MNTTLTPNAQTLLQYVLPIADNANADCWLTIEGILTDQLGMTAQDVIAATNEIHAAGHTRVGLTWPYVFIARPGSTR